MNKLTIFANGEHHSIDEALEMLTGDWIDDGNCSAQTVIDLRDALIKYMERCEYLLEDLMRTHE